MKVRTVKATAAASTSGNQRIGHGKDEVWRAAALDETAGLGLLLGTDCDGFARFVAGPPAEAEGRPVEAKLFEDDGGPARKDEGGGAEGAGDAAPGKVDAPPAGRLDTGTEGGVVPGL